QWERIAADFSRQWNFPNCVGALDGKHVAIEALPGAGSDTFKYKGFHSIVLMACCDPSYKFTLVDVGQPGRYSDGGVFPNSEMGERMLSDTAGLPPPAHLIARQKDEAAICVCGGQGISPSNLMRPFPRKDLKLPQKVFNFRLSRARRVIESTFGILMTRWRI
ncbi:unnamed protein product, partial [Ixodes hexagonus]